MARNGWVEPFAKRPAAFRLCCRGGIRLFDSTRDLTPKSKKGRALLALLAAENRPLSRIRIIDLLWSDRQEEQARASLRTLLADLRVQWGADFASILVAEREQVALAPSVRNELSQPAFDGSGGELFEGLDHLDPEFDEWLRLERGKASVERQPAPAAHPAIAGTSSVASAGNRVHRLTRQRMTIIIALLALAAVAALVWSKGWMNRPDDPVVAVLPFRDTTGRYGLLAEGLAEDLRVHLAERGGLQVIGRLSSEAPAVRSGGASAARRMLGANYLIEGSVLAGPQLRLSVRLIDTRRDKVIWNHVVAAQPALISAGPAPMANLIAAEVLDTVVQAGPDFAFEADAAAFRDLFQARRLLARLDSNGGPEARRILTGVIARHPRFVPALAAYAEATIRSSDHPYYRGTVPLREARWEGERKAREALRLAPNFALAHLALGQVRVDLPEALQPLRRAVELAPGNFRAQYRLARALELAGDLEGALSHARRAATLEPLDPLAAVGVASKLQFFGEFESIRRIRDGFIERSSEPLDELRVDSITSGFLGDYSRSLQAARGQVALAPDDQQARRGLSVALDQLGEDAAAARFAQPGSISALVLNRDVSSLLAKIGTLGSDFWSLNYETIGAAELLSASGRDREIVAAFDRADGALSEDMAGAGPVILALRANGRRSDAQALLALYERSLTRRSRGLPPAVRESLYAEYYALSGQGERALESLEQNFALSWTWLDAGFTPLLESAAFRSLRSNPRFLALKRRFLAELNRERREAGITTPLVV